MSNSNFHSQRRKLVIDMVDSHVYVEVTELVQRLWAGEASELLDELQNGLEPLAPLPGNALDGLEFWTVTSGFMETLRDHKACSFEWAGLCIWVRGRELFTADPTLQRIAESML
jgi:hypothetical protein